MRRPTTAVKVCLFLLVALSIPATAQTRCACVTPWVDGGLILGAKIVKPADAGKWFRVDGAALQLADPFDPEFSGMKGRSIVIEQADNAANATIVTVTGGGEKVRLPGGAEVTSWFVPFETGTKPRHVFVLTASPLSNGPAWLVTEGP